MHHHTAHIQPTKDRVLCLRAPLLATEELEGAAALLRATAIAERFSPSSAEPELGPDALAFQEVAPRPEARLVVTLVAVVSALGRGLPPAAAGLAAILPVKFTGLAQNLQVDPAV